MINNKILTVSYGTFSCTLEGFDDSFGTMKAIAEYFRDLAADDRYFGAEPPQPDAQMLASIAQREVSRKVHAHEKDGKIVLSALADQRTIDTDHEDQITQADETARAAPAAAVLASVAAAEVTPQPQDVEPPVATVDVAPKAVETTSQADDLPIDPTPVEAADAPLSDAPLVVVTMKPDAEDENDADEMDIVPGQPDAEVEAFFADATQPAPLQDTSAAGTDNILAKLQRIRAVVAQNKTDTDKGTYAEDQHADAKARSAEQDITYYDTTEMPDDADATTPPQAPETSLAETSVVEAVTDALLTEPSDKAPLPETAPITVTGTPEEDENDDVDAILQRLASATSADDDKNAEDDDLLGTDTLNLFEDTIGSQEESDAPEQTTQENAVHGRVIKVNRAALETAIENGTLEEYADDIEMDASESPSLDQIAPSQSKISSLTPQDEEDLARELATLEAETDDSDTDLEQDVSDSDVAADLDAEETQTGVRRSDQRSKRALDDTDRGTDVNRLLAEADHQMDEPESATRRNAFSHLRAAVASQKAEVALGKPADEDNTDKAYRGDLAEVVRPRRPETAGQRTARPDDARPAPLKLVAEQRIDGGTQRNEEPVRPRRVTAIQEPAATTQDADSFAEYAADVGADTLPQLLEAAASYMAFVEGRDQFSRPQLMTKVRQSGAQEDFSREDGLRSFGQLLRAGKISKIKGGRFTVSDDIGFQPNERAAG